MHATLKKSHQNFVKMQQKKQGIITFKDKELLFTKVTVIITRYFYKVTFPTPSIILCELRTNMDKWELICPLKNL